MGERQPPDQDKATKQHQDDIEKTDHAQLSEFYNTATIIDSAKELLPRKRSIDQSRPKNEVASPHLLKKLKKDEATMGSASVISHPNPCLPPLAYSKGEQCMPLNTLLESSQNNPVVESSSDRTNTLGGDVIKLHKEETEKRITVLGTGEQPQNTLLNDFEGILRGNPLDGEASMQNDDAQKPLDNSNEASSEHENLPFVKRSPLWKNLESMEILRSLPQHPHFQSLQQMNKLLHEGLAFGYMMSFVNVVEETRNAQIEEPNDTLENNMNAVFELKALGFDVQQIQTRLQDLQRIKNKQVELDVELNQIEEKIKDEELLMVEVNEEIISLEPSIGNLKEKGMTVLKKKLRKRFRIADIQKKIKETEKCIDGVRLDFEHIATAPWRIR